MRTAGYRRVYGPVIVRQDMTGRSGPATRTAQPERADAQVSIDAKSPISTVLVRFLDLHEYGTIAAHGNAPVSYTHLTLPTICSV